jgi:hypothetical protein
MKLTGPASRPFEGSERGTGTFTIDTRSAPGILALLPRAARVSFGGICYHVVNRGNGRRQVFRNESDYQAFLIQ